VNLGKPLDARALGKRWKTAIRSLGPERVKQLSIMCGRHSFCTQLLRRRFDLPTVQAFAGHASITQTSSYLEIVPEPDFVPRGKCFSL
jgi:site-specific recombinase XerD